MIRCTITLTSTPHQIVLWFKTAADIETATTREEGGTTCIVDEYGTSVRYAKYEVAFILSTDVEQELQRKNEKRMLEMEAEYQLQKAIQDDPTLALLSGRGINFGKH